ncbi:MAG: metallophosphoesterase [Clostridiales bacterium]|nr:metallophosphoesterase [Clostridiales bacterium]
MNYVISDIHGCYRQYMKMLGKIGFADDDKLYVLGDVVDRGPEPIEVLMDMSVRANVIPIMGNHEYIAYFILKQLLLEFTDKNLVQHFVGGIADFYQKIGAWVKIGGKSTLEGFGKLPQDDREAVVDYLSEFSLYEIVEVNGKNFILTHSGPPRMTENIDRLDAFDFATSKTDYDKVYFKDAFTVTGHIPTFRIDETCRGRIYRKNNHIAIDTGAPFIKAGGALSCICLDTDEEFYV